MFGLGELVAFQPISAGIENSNYFVTLDRGDEPFEYVLTLLEGFSFAEAPYFSRILSALHQQGLPVAAPVPTLDGMTSTSFCGKPTFLCPRLPGRHLEQGDSSACQQIGRFIAASHQLCRFDGDGQHTATYAQEVLLRLRRGD